MRHIHFNNVIRDWQRLRKHMELYFSKFTFLSLNYSTYRREKDVIFEINCKGVPIEHTGLFLCNLFLFKVITSFDKKKGIIWRVIYKCLREKIWKGS